MAVTVPGGASTPVWYDGGFRQCHVFTYKGTSDDEGLLTCYLTDDGTSSGEALFTYAPVVTASAEGGYLALVDSLSSDLTALTVKTYELLAPVTPSGAYAAKGDVTVHIIAIGR